MENRRKKGKTTKQNNGHSRNEYRRLMQISR
jgi:hypothetical protein